MSVPIHLGMTVAQLAEILEATRWERDVEAYIRVESIRGKPVAYLVREPKIPVLPAAPAVFDKLFKS